MIRVAIGHDQSLGDLSTFEALVGAQPRTQPFDEYPIRERTLDGRTRGRGTRAALLDFDTVDMEVIQSIASVFVPTPPLLDVAVTVLLVDAQRQWVLCNAYLVQPQPGEDYELENGQARNLVVRLNNVEVI